MNTSSSQTCQNCKNQFVIEPDDFAFYGRIKVPPPTFCPECRMQRRLVWRNEKTFFKRKCGAPGHEEEIITIYSEDAPFTVFDHGFWYSDQWDPLSYGQEYDFSRPFFEQFGELLKKVPHVALFDSKSVNSRYVNVTVEHKNCYLVTAGWNNEDSLYSNRISYCKDTADSYICHKTEFSYENVYCKNSNRLFYSLNSEGCSNSYFLYDCVNCSDCVGCANLRNKQYYIFNQPYSKEEYLKKLEELDLKSVSGIAQISEKFGELYLRSLHRYAQLINTTNVTGDNIERSRNCYYCFDLAGEAENVKYSHWGTYGLREAYDTGPGTGGNSELLYEGISIGVKNARCKFGVIVWYSHDVEYGFNCQDSNDLFGCVGLRGKQYCILNKQYSKEEYEKLIPKIVEHMNASPYTDKKGNTYRYGEFFPSELSPWSYNETVAQDYLPLSEQDALKNGFAWHDAKARNYSITKQASALPERITDVSDEILKDVIGCAHEGACNQQCTAAFKIIPQELEFYRRMNLPLPRLCPNCRHGERLKKRNPLKLWHRTCACAGGGSESNIYKNTTAHFHGETRCPNEFETSYAPERPEIVYCESCYQKEVV